MFQHAVPARVGLLGNPSDGYGGRTLALAVPHFEATVTVEPSDGVKIVPNVDDIPRWPSVRAMGDHLDRFGYGNGPQLLAATARTFVDLADSIGQPVDSGFTLSYETTIPRQVGLAGSSALVISALKGLNELFNINVPSHILPSVALAVETSQLGLSAGLQDRVVQTYGGLMCMDFGPMTTDSRFGVRHGVYEQLDPSKLPLLFLAYRSSAAEPSDTYHQRLRTRYNAGEGEVRMVLGELAGLALEGRAAVRWNDHDLLAKLIGRNMALRQSLGPIPDHQLELVEIAESAGTTATFAGSGGAVVGVIKERSQIDSLTRRYGLADAQMVLLNDTQVLDDSSSPAPTATADNDEHPSHDANDDDDSDDNEGATVFAFELRRDQT